ncbi:hypothetical protein DL766_007209 [Monosporascus sp. MC13-8B]|uniref:Uncharacterized protein n=1 Tax=Monosporascus cannonballus TaxID=155416 RepID=A0ABY0GVG1_9PEZI|nr:hypothetical protein DL762_008940 [Monosporascus cannonballus]RYO89690.1 hypothetical protein DL763_005571 [Monosporascus cannonballus]RYP24871.1 hypothetical protein DL766_007209 [Monosporascus sp. MC13-8B]
MGYVNREDAARVVRYSSSGEGKVLNTILAQSDLRRSQAAGLFHVIVLEAKRLLDFALQGNTLAMDFYAKTLASRGETTRSVIYSDSQAVDPEKKSVLHAAAEGGQNDIAKYMACEVCPLTPRDPKDDATKRGINKQNYESQQYKQHEVMRYLIRRCVDIDKRTLSGKTALHIAVRNDDARVVQILLDAGIRIVTKDMGGRTAFDIAVYEKKPGAAAALQARRGFNPRAPVFRPFEFEGCR